MTVAELKLKLNRLPDDMHIACEIWHTQDVENVEEKRGITLTPKQRNEFLDYLEDTHNAEVGINWEVMDVMMDFFLENCE